MTCKNSPQLRFFKIGWVENTFFSILLIVRGVSILMSISVICSEVNVRVRVKIRGLKHFHLWVCVRDLKKSKSVTISESVSTILKISMSASVSVWIVDFIESFRGSNWAKSYLQYEWSLSMLDGHFLFHSVKVSYN